MQLVKRNDAGLPSVANMTDEELMSELAAYLEITARHLMRLSEVWSELERRGVDLSNLRSGLREWLPMIASGRLSAEAVVQFAGQPNIIRALSELPVKRQTDFARGEEVVVVTFGPAGGVNSEKLPLQRLNRHDIALVFDKGHIRSASEQIPLLHDRARRLQRRSAETVSLSFAASQYQALVRAARSKRMRVSTLIMDILRADGVLG